MEKTGSSKSLIFLKIAMMLVVGSVVLPTTFKAIAIVLLVISIIIEIFRRPFAFRKKYVLYTTAFVVVAIITLLYSQDQKYGVRKLTTMLPLLVFPLSFGFFHKDLIETVKKWKWTLLSIYIVSVFIFNVFPFIYLWLTHYSFSELIIHYATVIRVDFGKFSIHPIYLSMHNGLAILFSFFLIVSKIPKRYIYGFLAIDIVLLLYLFLYAKKGPILALILMLVLALIFHRKNKLFKPYLLIITILIGLVIAIPKTRNNFIELLTIEMVDTGAINSTNIRYSIYDTSLDVIKEAPFLGYGIGDYRAALTNKFQEDGNATLYKGNYNAHNQFLSFLLMGGLLLLVPFLLFLFITALLAIRYDNQLLILTLIFYCIVMLTENILERESGVLYFSLFLSYFSLFNPQK